MQFGLSTHVFHGERLTRRHLEAIAQHGFDAVELFATQTHFDYHDSTHIDELGRLSVCVVPVWGGVGSRNRNAGG